MIQHPAEWNPNDFQLEISHCKRRWYAFAASLVLCIAVAWGCIYDVISHFAWEPKPGYHLGFIALHFNAIMACGAVPLVVIHLAFNNHFYVGTNKLLSFQSSLKINFILIPEFRMVLSNRMIEIGNLSLLFITSFVVILPFLILSTSLYFNYDPYYFILNDIFGPDERSSVLVSNLRFGFRFLTVLAGFECSRTAVFMVLYLSIILFEVFLCIQRLVSLKLTRSSFRAIEILRIYTKFLVAFSKIENFVMQLVSILISIFYWAMVFLSWIVIRLRERIPDEMYAFILVLDVVLWLFTISFIIVVCSMDDIVSGMVNSWRLDAARNYCATRFFTAASKRKLFYIKKWSIALQPLRLKYEPFLVLDQQFIRDFFSQVVERVFDAIIISGT